MVFIWDQPTIWDRRLIPLINFLSKIRDENVTNFASFSVNSLASYSSASEVVAAEETIQPTSTRSKLLISAVTQCHTFVSPSPWSFCGTLSLGVTICWSPIPTCLSQAPRLPSSYLHQAAWPCCCPPQTDAEVLFCSFSYLSLSWGQQINIKAQQEKKQTKQKH